MGPALGGVPSQLGRRVNGQRPVGWEKLLQTWQSQARAIIEERKRRREELERPARLAEDAKGKRL